MQFYVSEFVVTTVESGDKHVFEIDGGIIGGSYVNPKADGEVYTNYVSVTKGLPHNREFLRHATDAEIEAGWREDSSEYKTYWSKING